MSDWLIDGCLQSGQEARQVGTQST